MIAALWDHYKCVSPGRIDNEHVTNMSANKPGDEKDAKRPIADCTITEVLKHFSKLFQAIVSKRVQQRIEEEALAHW